MISHVEQRSSRRESRGWFFFLARVVEYAHDYKLNCLYRTGNDASFGSTFLTVPGAAPTVDGAVAYSPGSSEAILTCNVTSDIPASVFVNDVFLGESNETTATVFTYGTTSPGVLTCAGNNSDGTAEVSFNLSE